MKRHLIGIQKARIVTFVVRRVLPLELAGKTAISGRISLDQHYEFVETGRMLEVTAVSVPDIFLFNRTGIAKTAFPLYPSLR